MATPIKGVRDIRTHLGRNPGQREPYQLFMEISGLEMERARRGKERSSALQRVAGIEARFAEIEATKTRLLAEAAAAQAGGPPGPAERREAEKARRESVLSRTAPSSQGFKIKY